MFPLAWRHMSPWFRLFEKIFSLLPLSRVIYNVREPAEVSRCEAHWVFSITTDYVFTCDLTRTLSSHVIPELDALCLGISRVYRRDKDCGLTSRKNIGSSGDHHVEAYRQQGRERSHLSFLQHATWYHRPPDSPIDVSRVWSVLGPIVELVCPLRWCHKASPEVVNPQRWSSKEHILGMVHSRFTKLTSSMATRPSKPERITSKISWKYITVGRRVTKISGIN